ncbi:phage head closure protein [Herbaspirillum seropedicae]|uniref:phage head closure protein n=1 Tax=Herbaspirillum seropedicae TaxID=964 RepID=UPI003FCDF483
MRPGELNRRITIEQVSNVKNSDGDLVAAWVTVTELWARRADVSGRELEAAMAKDVEISVKFVVRYRNGILPNMRVVLDGQYYRVIAALDKSGRREELHIYCATGLLDVSDVE